MWCLRLWARPKARLACLHLYVHVYNIRQHLPARHAGLRLAGAGGQQANAQRRLRQRAGPFGLVCFFVCCDILVVIRWGGCAFHHVRHNVTHDPQTTRTCTQYSGKAPPPRWARGCAVASWASCTWRQVLLFVHRFSPSATYRRNAWRGELTRIIHANPQTDRCSTSACGTSSAPPCSSPPPPSRTR